MKKLKQVFFSRLFQLTEQEKLAADFDFYLHARMELFKIKITQPFLTDIKLGTYPKITNTLNLFYKQRSSKRLVYGFLNFDSRCLVLLLR